MINIGFTTTFLVLSNNLIELSLHWLLKGVFTYKTRSLINYTNNDVNIGEYYMFQPVEIENKHISRYERVHPIDFKRKSIIFNLLIT